MILLYHKVDTDNKTHWWVSADTFYRQLVQLSGKKVVYLDDYNPEDPDHVVITFDGIYKNILRYAAPILKKFNYPFELFVTSDYIGKSNKFDGVEPPCDFASESELKELMEMGGRLQWHTKTHRDITKLSDKEVEKEVTTPERLKKLDPNGFRWFAYAYGSYDERSQALVKKLYAGGLACDNGSIENKTIWPRLTTTEETSLITEKVSVIIPCYNYAQFLVEAIESVLRQTYLPDEILLSDDASTDHSYQIMQVYARQYPGLIKVNRNRQNIGIEKHFNTAIKKTSGDFVCFLGADNRFPSNYLESTLSGLLVHKKAAIAYTDFALFSNRAENVYRTFDKHYQGQQVEGGVFIINFPVFNKKSRETLLKKGNFIHGSSLYRREAYVQAGGYKSRVGGPEDYALFQSMVLNGWEAIKTPGVYLEYRQHSAEQANLQFSYFGELAFLRKQFIELENVIQTNLALNQQLIQLKEQYLNLENVCVDLRKHIELMEKSKIWRVRTASVRARNLVKHPLITSKKVHKKLSRKIKS